MFESHLDHLQAELARVLQLLRRREEPPLWPEQERGAEGDAVAWLAEDDEANRIDALAADAEIDLPLVRLASLYALDRLDMDLLLSVLLADIEPRASVTWRLRGGPLDDRITLDALTRAHGNTFAARLEIHHRAGPSGDLVAHGLLRYRDPEPGASPSTLFPRLAPKIKALMLGWPEADPALAGVARVSAAMLRPDQLVASPDIDALVAETPVDRPTMCVVTGPQGSGRRRVAEVLATRAGRSLLLVDGDKLTPDVASAVFQECWIEGHLLCLKPAIAALGVLGAETVARWCAQLSGPLILIDSSPRGWPPLPASAPTRHFALDAPTEAGRQRLWDLYLAPFADRLDDVDTAALAKRHAVTGAVIAAAVEQAVALSDPDASPITQQALDEICRR